MSNAPAAIGPRRSPGESPLDVARRIGWNGPMAAGVGPVADPHRPTPPYFHRNRHAIEDR
jgi:hypothetical protein